MDLANSCMYDVVLPESFSLWNDIVND